MLLQGLKHLHKQQQLRQPQVETHIQHHVLAHFIKRPKHRDRGALSPRVVDIFVEQQTHHSIAEGLGFEVVANPHSQMASGVFDGIAGIPVVLHEQELQSGPIHG